MHFELTGGIGKVRMLNQLNGIKGRRIAISVIGSSRATNKLSTCGAMHSRGLRVSHERISSTSAGAQTTIHAVYKFAGIAAISPVMHSPRRIFISYDNSCLNSKG